ncbi:MAG: OmpP1/FadL family transporter [Hyphomicrobiaceae bacterium]
MNKRIKTMLTATAVSVVGLTSVAHAGGFAIREQSTSSQGASFAGSAAGGDLSSMFWNPAALAASEGTNSESHFAVFFGDSRLTADATPSAANSLPGQFPTASLTSGDIAEEAVIPSSYFGTQLSENLWAGMAVNSPFGLVTKPADRDWVGAPIARKSKIFTLNANPNVAYQILPGVSIGAGVQVQYMDAEFKFGRPGGESVVFSGDDVGFGGTAGLYLTPAQGTQIGIGYRSRVKHSLKGDLGPVSGVGFIVPIPVPPAPIPGLTTQLPAAATNKVDLTTPDIVTLSLRQAVSPSMRVMATFEWTNWSVFDVLEISNATPAGAATGAIDANWHDAWFASVGAEFDMTDVLTVRGGVAYEESPIQNPAERLTPVPDADRIWVSAGATYRFNEHTTFDFAYTHVFVDEARFSRASAVNPAATLQGTAETDVNLVSFSIKSKLDENHPIFGSLFQ